MKLTWAPKSCMQELSHPNSNVIMSSLKVKALLLVFMIFTLGTLPPLTYACSDGNDPNCHWHCHPKSHCRHKPPPHHSGHPKKSPSHPPIIVLPPPTSPPIIVKPPPTYPPIIVKPPPTSPPVIVKPPPTYPPIIVKPPPVSPPVIVKPPPTAPPVIVYPPPVVPTPPVIVNPPPPYGGVPAPPPLMTCPIDALKLGLCLDVLQGLVHVGIGNPIENVCCPVIQGLLDLEAAVCLCTVIRLKLLNLNIFVPLALQVLATCGLTPPPGFVCPPL